MVIYTFKLNSNKKVNMSVKVKPKSINLNLFGFNADAKTSKGNKQKQYYTSILYLAPDVEAYTDRTQDNDLFFKTVCPWSSAGCRGGCLYDAGLGAVYPKIQQARIRKTRLYHEDKTEFFRLFHQDLNKFTAFCGIHKVKPAVRDDGTSDLGMSIVASKEHPKIQFYNYTKSVKRYYNFLNGRYRDNVHFTFSRSEENEGNAFEILDDGGQVAFVFRKKIPSKYKGYTVINGDLTDLRFTDREVFNIPADRGFIVGLTAKGKAKKDTTGFVIDL